MRGLFNELFEAYMDHPVFWTAMIGILVGLCCFKVVFVVGEKLKDEDGN